MRFTVQEAHDLVARVMQTLGHDDADSQLIAAHLIDCELRGLAYGGLARALSIAERFARTGDRRRPIRILHETPVSARIDGGARNDVQPLRPALPPDLQSLDCHRQPWAANPFTPTNDHIAAAKLASPNIISQRMSIWRASAT